jgi:hypothetical protein
MKKQKSFLKSGIGFFAVILWAAIFSGCSNLLEPPAGAAGGDKASVTVTLGNMRTLMPGLNLQSFASFTYAVTTGEDDISSPVNETDITEFPFSIPLNKGTWRITVYAYIADNAEPQDPAASGSALVTINGNEHTQVDINLVPPEKGGKGTFSYNVTLPAVPFTSARLILHPLIGEDPEDIKYNLLSEGLSGSRELDSGFYLLRILLECGGVKVGKAEAVHIYPGQVTEADIDEFTAGDFTEQKLLIWQAYGAMANDSPVDGAVSHNFVELYNPTDEDISLEDYSLWYRYKVRAIDTNVTEPDTWLSIELNGADSVKARSSYLILGKLQNTSPRLDLDGQGDETHDDFELYNRDFTLVLMKGGDAIDAAVENPFDTGDGHRVPGYVDMLGVKNGDKDPLLGTETEAPTIISKQKAARRLTVVDTNNNKKDFDPVDYRVVDGTDGINDAKCEFYRPKNTAYGPWDPEALPDIVILQAYGTGGKATPAGSHSYVELYNRGKAVDLAGYSLQYKDANTNAWIKLNLTKKIPAGGSFLVLGKHCADFTSLDLDLRGKADMVWDINLDNKAFSLVLLKNTNLLQPGVNPFDIDDQGKKFEGYVDMLGIYSAPAPAPGGSEGDPFTGISKHKSARRDGQEPEDLVDDTDDNAADFAVINFEPPSLDNGKGRSNLTAQELAKFLPKNASDGSWDPEYTPPPPPQEQTERLMIFQVYGTGDNYHGVEGTTVKAEGSISHSFIELYNNTDEAIDFDTTPYSIQWANPELAAGEGGSLLWFKADLTGSVPAYGSYLIMSPQVYFIEDAATTGHALVRLVLDEGESDLLLDDPGYNDDGDSTDTEAWYDDGVPADMILDNDGFIVALVGSHTRLTNPLENEDCVDLVGAHKTAGIHEGSGPASVSKQRSVRRIGLLDTDDNAADFAGKDYRTNGLSDPEVAKFRPRSSNDETWAPEF